jgi:hypothetical protein
MNPTLTKVFVIVNEGLRQGCSFDCEGVRALAGGAAFVRWRCLTFRCRGPRLPVPFASAPRSWGRARDRFRQALLAPTERSTFDRSPRCRPSAGPAVIVQSRTVRCIAMLVLLPRGAAVMAQSVPRAHVFAVVDQNSRQPIAGVEVRDSLSGKSAVTSAAGTVTLDFITPVNARIRLAAIIVRKVGYKPLTLLVPMAGDTTTAEMEPTAPRELPAVVSSEHHRLDTDPGVWDGFRVRCESRLVRGQLIPSAFSSSPPALAS